MRFWTARDRDIDDGPSRAEAAPSITVYMFGYECWGVTSAPEPASQGQDGRADRVVSSAAAN